MASTMPTIQAWLKPVADTASIDVTGVAFIVALGLGYPLAALYRAMSSMPPLGPMRERAKHGYMVLAGMGLLWGLFGHDAWWFLLQSLVTYVLLYLGFPSQRHAETPHATSQYVTRKHLWWPGGCTVAMVFLWNFVLFYYLLHMDDPMTPVTITTPICVLVLRLIGLAFDLRDGHVDLYPPSDSTASASNAAPSKDRIVSHGHVNAMEGVPGILEYLGFVYSFYGLLAGPQYPFKRYKRYIHLDLFQTPSKGTNDVVRNALPPGSYARAFRQCFLGLVYLAFHLVLALHFPQDLLTSPAVRGAPSLLYRVFVLCLHAKAALSKYIAIWLIVDGAVVLGGLGFNGYNDHDHTARWDGLCNTRPDVFEPLQSLNDVVASFNINTNAWVKYYIFKRLRWLNNKRLSQLASLTFLALWHGWYPGYGVAFGLELLDFMAESRVTSLWQGMEVGLMRHIDKGGVKGMAAGIVRWGVKPLVAYSWSWFALCYGYTAFELRHWSDVQDAYHVVGYCGHWIVGLIIVLAYRISLQATSPRKKTE